jgi:hypothetical protein
VREMAMLTNEDGYIYIYPYKKYTWKLKGQLGFVREWQF